MTIEKTIEKVRKGGAIKSEDIPYQEYTEVGLGGTFATMVQQFDNLAGVIKLAEAEKKELGEKIKLALAEGKVDRARITPQLRVLASQGRTTWIDKTSLLENGVSMDVIEASTKEKKYIKVQTYNN